MNKNGNKRGMCSKNGQYEKAGLTEDEVVWMLKKYVGDKQRWKFLFSLPNGRDKYVEPPPRVYKT
jgi:hypothetical protein